MHIPIITSSQWFWMIKEQKDYHVENLEGYSIKFLRLCLQLIISIRNGNPNNHGKPQELLFPINCVIERQLINKSNIHHQFCNKFWRETFRHKFEPFSPLENKREFST